MTLKSEIPSGHVSNLPSSILTISSSHNFLPGGSTSLVAPPGGSSSLLALPGGPSSLSAPPGGSSSIAAPPGHSNSTSALPGGSSSIAGPTGAPQTGATMVHSGIKIKSLISDFVF